MTPEIGVAWIPSLYLTTPFAYDLDKGLSSLDNCLSGLSPSLICFGSNVSLSTLRPCRYLQTRKTRYMVGLVPLPWRDFHPQDRRRLPWRHVENLEKLMRSTVIVD